MHDLTGIRDEFGPEFEILRVLGRGGVSVVYLARDRMLGRSVAIKVIDDRYLADAEALARFRREAQLLAQLQHPCIVPVHAARRMADGRVALVMQHMEGPTLRELIRREGPLPFARAEQILRDVADALGYLHRRGVVHRDVKPENIYVEPDGSHAFLADFGIARPLDGDSGLTLTGVVLGTPTYMSPEQIDGAWLNGQSDLYSLGLVGWEMLTGRRPWGGETLYTVIYKQKHEYLPLLEQLRPGIPERLREAVERALLKDRALRWPSVEVFLQQLGGPAPALPAAADGAAPLAALPAPGVPEEDELTRVMRAPLHVPAPAHAALPVHAPAPVPVEVEEVWRETTATVEQRTHVRRRRTAVLATAAALTLGGLTAGAALFATISDRDPFVAFAPAAETAAPAAARPTPAVPTQAAPSAAAPAGSSGPAPGSPAGAAAAAPPVASAPAPAPAPAETTRRADRPTAESPRRRGRRTAAESARRRRPPARPRAAVARPPASPVPAVQEPAPEPRLAGEPKLVGTPVNERVRTLPVRTGSARASSPPTPR